MASYDGLLAGVASPNWLQATAGKVPNDYLVLAVLATVLAMVLACACKKLLCLLSRHPIYLLDFTCYRPPDDRKVSKHYFINNSRLIGLFTNESIDFQKKILERSGLGQETYFPPAVTNMPPNPCLEEARAEAQAVIFGCLDKLLARQPGSILRQVGILIVNCSAFCPVPSLTALIINKYKLRSNVMAYNLSGMGCSASVISVDLAKRLLGVHSCTYALVVSTENITLNWYRGNDKNMLVSNCIFRMGGAAILLSNIRSDRPHSKYELIHTLRTTKAAENRSFFCVQQEEDEKGILGVHLSKELMRVAAAALRTNISSLGPKVLPWFELLTYAASKVKAQVRCSLKLKPGATSYHVPDFTKAFEHFCVHAGGRAVLDEVEKSLCLSKWHMEPSRMTLHRFGNTSSSSLWYELAYLEAKGRVRKNDRVWQIGFGSGFKCNSAVWRSLQTIGTTSPTCWSEFIHAYPVDVPCVDQIKA